MKKKLKLYINSIMRNVRSLFSTLLTVLKDLFIGLCIGGIVGFISSIFSLCLSWAANMRAAYPDIKLALPIAGLIIILLYKGLNDINDHGTNTVIASIRNSAKIPFRMAPLIFVSTILTHLCGGSAGREGAAIQLGGSIANRIGTAFGLDDNNRHLIVLCGMSAGFSALFGTPLASAFFSLEVISVGILHYSALIPCVASAFTAKYIAGLFGIRPDAFALGDLPAFTPQAFCLTIVLGVLCGIVSAIFCRIMHHTAGFLKSAFNNPYIRIILVGGIVVALSFIPGFDIYLGPGMNIISDVFDSGHVVPYAFFIKMIFTALTLGGGFRGGEIVPSLCIGASFGCAAATLFGLPVPIAAACGMVGVFCGVTNCPISSLLIGFELFGFGGMPFFLITIAVCYVVSGYTGLYNEQKIIYSKTETRFVDRKTK